jgi:hypothetical protein
MSSETERIAAGLIACTLPKAEWTHEAHLRAGVWHVIHSGGARALAQLRERIARYNESVGTPNTDSSGYHETVTRFYVSLITAFIARQEADLSADQLADRLIAAYGRRDLPLQYYSRERLFSVQARRGWLAPDLAQWEWDTVDEEPQRSTR